MHKFSDLKQGLVPIKKGNIWLDLDNLPHVQYILPVGIALRDMGYDIFITSRDYGNIPELLKLKGINSKVIGKGFNKNKYIKILETIIRAIKLLIYIKKIKPILSLSNSRATALTSWLSNVRNFTFCDYEKSELKSYKTLNSYLVFPAVIPKNVFLDIGFSKNKLIEYDGLKENLTLSSFNIPTKCPVAGVNLDRVIVLIRPPSFNSHYYRAETGILFDELENYLIKNITAFNLELIFIPRDKNQFKKYKKKYNRSQNCTVLSKPLEGLSLIWYSDLVFTGGGTMGREAAVLGVPAFNVFLSESAAVDHYLESKRLLTFIREKEDFDKIIFRKVKHKLVNVDSFREFPKKVAHQIIGKI